MLGARLETYRIHTTPNTEAKEGKLVIPHPKGLDSHYSSSTFLSVGSLGGQEKKFLLCFFGFLIVLVVFLVFGG